MSELPGGVEPAAVPRPRESALGILLGPPRDGRRAVLLGLRSGDARFMPGHLAFPGGKLDPSDRPADAGAHRRCASRELREETGLEVRPEEWHEGGVRVTPPMFPVRFRTEFLVAEAADERLPEHPPTPENERLLFADPADVLRDWEEGRARVAPPVLAVLRELAAIGSVDVAESARRVARANDGENEAPRIEFVPGVRVFPVATDTLPPATHTNVWMPAGERFAVVDPGSSRPEEVAGLLAVCRRLQREGSRPVAVVLTHHHRDHVAGAAQVARALGVPVRAHERALARAAGVEGFETAPIVDGEVLDLGGRRMEARLTEGHAAGHLAFWLAQDRALIGGDLVSALSTILIDPDHGDMDAYLESLERMAALKPRTVLPGHGPPVPGLALRKAHAHRLVRENRILDALARGLDTSSAIAAKAYEDTPGAPPFLAERQALAHLLRLERAGRVRRAGECWVRV